MVTCLEYFLIADLLELDLNQFYSNVADFESVVGNRTNTLFSVTCERALHVSNCLHRTGPDRTAAELFTPAGTVLEPACICCIDQNGSKTGPALNPV